MNYSEIEEIFCLTSDKKYKYFFNAETEQVFGLKGKNVKLQRFLIAGVCLELLHRINFRNIHRQIYQFI